MRVIAMQKAARDLGRLKGKEVVTVTLPAPAIVRDDFL